MSDEFSDRYQAWLDAGKPEQIYSLWIQRQWRLYFTEVEGREPGSQAAVSMGVAINTAAEEMPFFVLEHQDEFDAWLTYRVRMGLDDLEAAEQLDAAAAAARPELDGLGLQEAVAEPLSVADDFALGR